MRKKTNEPLLHTVTLKVTTWSVNVWLHHRILGFVNGNTASKCLTLLHQFGICDLEEASSEGQEDGHLVLKPQTAWRISACLTVSCTHTNSTLTVHQVTFTFLALWRSILFVTDSIVKVKEHVSQWFFSQNLEFYGDHWQTLWNMTFGWCSVFSLEMLFLTNVFQ